MTTDILRRTDMTVEKFLQWNLSQDERYELVDGVSVPLRSMAGARGEHDAVVVNLIVALGNQLEGTPSRPATADTALRTKIKRVRRPDVAIECAPVERGSLEARNPVAVFEILSPTTCQLDHSEKLHEYLRHPSLTTIVHIDPGIMDVMVYARGSDGSWDMTRLDKPDDTVRVAGTSAAVLLATLYRGVPLTIPPADKDLDDEHR